jgi:hypothetical protein
MIAAHSRLHVDQDLAIPATHVTSLCSNSEAEAWLQPLHLFDLDRPFISKVTSGILHLLKVSIETRMGVGIP